MALDEELSKFIGDLYEAVYDPDRWRKAIDDTIRLTGSRLAVVTSIDLQKSDFAGIQLHGPESRSIDTGKAEYKEVMHETDPTLNWSRRHPGNGFCDTTGIIPKSDYRDHAFIKWCRDRFGSQYWRLFYTETLDDLLFSLSLHAPADGPLPTRKQLEFEALLFENLERAVRLAARAPDFAADDSALVAIDVTGRPLSLSQRAEYLIEAADGLHIKDGILAATHPETNHQVQRAIHAAVDPNCGERLGRGVRIKRSHGKSDLFLIVSRFPPALDHLPRPTPTALVRLVEVAVGQDHLAEHSHLFGFSPREAEVASALLQGHSLDSMAATLGLSRNTARNHLQSLFRKTDTGRQSDLIRLLDRVTRQ